MGITPACAGNRGCSGPPRRPARDHPRLRGEQVRVCSRPAPRAGSPPPARGTASIRSLMEARLGITPACAGNSVRPRASRRCRRDHPACAGNRPAGRRRFRWRGDHPRLRGEQITCMTATAAWCGSPPPARGTEVLPLAASLHRGITPACAGNRCARCSSAARTADHPRLRGEQMWIVAWLVDPAGSPPPARGTGVQAEQPGGERRITPACAGNRKRSWPSRAAAPDHPRLRGEQSFHYLFLFIAAGSPPPARGTGGLANACPGRVGITPACAGNSKKSPVLMISDSGSPPPARGTANRMVGTEGVSGITPACAGNRHDRRTQTQAGWDHPRLRGEQRARWPPASRPSGSPPPARGTVRHRRPRRELPGITPACAGNSPSPRCWGWEPRDHPRLRGEQQVDNRPARRIGGSPPPARGTATTRRDRKLSARITPACAGNRSGPAGATSRRRDHPRLRGEQQTVNTSGPERPGSPPPARGTGRSDLR